MNPYNQEKTREIWKRVLGEETETPRDAMDSETLLAMIRDEKTDACTYRKLARCFSGRCREQLLQIASEEYCHSKKLETVYFLWTGECACVMSESPTCYECLNEALRDRYQKELEGAAAYRQAAEELPEFQDIFYCLANGEQQHSATLLCILQSRI